MQRSSRRSRVVALAVTAVGAVLVALAVSVASVAAEAPAPKQSTARFEVRFMERMIDHHAMAVEMADMCVEKATQDDLRALCQGIIESQSSEIGTMQSWLAGWYGTSHEPEMSPGEMRQMDRLSTLTGIQFEIEFMREMIAHHETAVREAEKCLDRAAHADLLQLCNNIIESQTAEVEQMQAWLCEWYGLCDKKASVTY